MQYLQRQGSLLEAVVIADHITRKTLYSLQRSDQQ
jgi:hypothetical protein